MGLLDMLMPYQAGTTGLGPNRPAVNPFTGWVDSNPYAVMGLGQAAQGFFGGMAGATNAHDALVGATNGLNKANTPAYAQLQLQKAQQDKEAADAKAKQNATVAWIQKNAPKYSGAVSAGVMTPADAYKMALQDANGAPPGAAPSSVQEYQFYAQQEQSAGRQPVSYADWRKGANQTVRAGMGAPIWGKNRKTGEYMPFEPMSDGTISSLVAKDANPTDFVFDPGTVASDKAAGTAFGTAQGGVQFNMPAAKQNIDLEMANIDAIANDQTGLDQVFGNIAGVPQQWLPTMPGTPKANMQERIKQVVGQNFLQAYSSLRGAGAITEQEGAKAQDAMARLGTAQSKDAFIQALSELKNVLQIGYSRMAGQAGGAPYQSTGYTPPPLAGQNYNVDDLVTKYTGGQ